MDLVTLALAKRYIDKKISEEGVVTGATPQQAAQIGQNKTDIAALQAEVEDKQPKGNYVRSVNGMEADENGNVEISAGVDVSSAQVGQMIVIKTVDENEKPTEWEAVDKPAYIANVRVDRGRYSFVDSSHETLLNAYNNGAIVGLNANGYIYYLFKAIDDNLYFGQIPYTDNDSETASIPNYYLMVAPDNFITQTVQNIATVGFVNDVIRKSNLQADLMQNDPTKGDYVKGKEEFLVQAGAGQNFNLTSPNGTVWRLAIRDDGSVYGIAVNGDEGGEGEVVAFTPFNFVQISDSHASNSQPAIGVFVRDINMLTDVDFVTDSGDITLDQSKDDDIKEAELAEYKATLRDPLNVPIYPCVGGHDLCNSMDIIWPEYTGVERLQEIGHKGCVILLADCLLSGWLDWLEERVSANQGKRIFVLEHHPIENDEFTVGLKPGETRVTWGDSEMRRILRLLRNNHNIIWFTGHTHWAFGIAERDVYNDGGRMGAVVHTPYLNAYQGWMVEVGEAATMLRGVEFAEGGMRYLGEGYDYAITQDITDYGEAEIITEGETVALGGTVGISVYLAAAPRNSQTVHLTAADGISIDKTELVFTPANYAAPQTVTVTGNAAGTGKLTLYSRSRTTVRKIDVVAGSAVTNWFNKAKPLTPLGSYYGTGSSASYQLSNLIPAKTGDHVRSNALGSQTTMRLKMFDADFNYIAEAQNNVQTIDYTITEANVAYVSVVYRGATAGQADTIMVTVNQELPSEYVAYNAEPVGYAITNYADPDAPSVVGGYYNEFLTQAAADGTNVSNLFPVTPGDTVYSNGINLDTKPYLYVYDAERTLIERMNIGTGSITNPQAAYAAVCYAAGTDNLMVMINQMVPGYYVAGTDVM